MTGRDQKDGMQGLGGTGRAGLQKWAGSNGRDRDFFFSGLWNDPMLKMLVDAVDLKTCVQYAFMI